MWIADALRTVRMPGVGDRRGRAVDRAAGRHGRRPHVSPTRIGSTDKLAGFVGAASPFSGSNSALGLSLGWEMTPRFGLEGRGTWLSTPAGVTAFAAAFGARMAFVSARPILPFVSAGIGFYRTTFEAPSSFAMPHFYRQRMGGTGLVSETSTTLSSPLALEPRCSYRGTPRFVRS